MHVRETGYQPLSLTEENHIQLLLKTPINYPVNR